MLKENRKIGLSQKSFAGKISNASQIGGIETAVIDNGPGRGTRIAWINTGSGFRFKVVIDRAMDVVDAFFNEHSIAWLSHAGISSPQPFSDKGADWLRTFSGGLFTTCGLSHAGGPENDEYGQRGLHGLISNNAAEIESVIQPDPVRGKMEMSITGKIKESRIFGPSLELKRTISATLGESNLQLHDEVTNHGNTPAPHMLLYHFNFGWPLADEGAELIWKGKMQPVAGESAKKIFNDNNEYKKCPPPVEDHRAAGEAVAFFDIAENEQGDCICGIYNKPLGIAASLTFKKKELPWLTNWQHWGPGEYVTGIEPGTNPPIGQAAARKKNELVFIQPGETKTYTLELKILHNEPDIQELLKYR